MPIDKSIDYSEATPYICELSRKCIGNSSIDPALYTKYDVKRGLRDLNGNGVLTGLTEISDIVAFEMKDGVKTPCEGRLYYRGVNVRDIVRGFVTEGRFGFEEVVYLLLFGELPKEQELEKFRAQLSAYRALPTNFVRDVIMKAPSADMMNTLARSVLTLYGYDARADDNAPENVLRQCLQLMSNMPVLAIYAYQAWRFSQGESLFIHVPKPELSTAENFLRMLREDCSYTDLEARTLDVALILHADNGGGNNSTFTNHVVTSSGTDTYSAIAASMASLKGPRHGGANSKVMAMMDDVKEHVRDWNDEGCVADYLTRILNKDAFDRSGLIYGLGHAVYTKTDPRCEVFRAYVNHLAAEKGREDELALYANVEKIGKQLLMERQHKSVLSTNIDFYSGFVYEMLGLPKELYTPLFAVARIAGWSAHRMEELSVGGKLIRPRYECVEEHRPYTSMDRR